jgi:hypothetical protein
MLLPQSAAFRTLRDRLDAACSLRQNLSANYYSPPPLPPRPNTATSSSRSTSISVSVAEGEGEGSDVQQLEVATLLRQFKSVQQKHSAARRAALEVSVTVCCLISAALLHSVM